MTSFSSKKFFLRSDARNFVNTNDNFFDLKENQNIIIKTDSLISHDKTPMTNFFSVVSKGAQGLTKSSFLRLLKEKLSPYQAADELPDDINIFLDDKNTKFIKQTFSRAEIFTNRGKELKVLRAKKGGETFKGKFFKGGMFIKIQYLESD